jgi:peptide-methionine (S)-S-oxide reductase
MPAPPMRLSVAALAIPLAFSLISPLAHGANPPTPTVDLRATAAGETRQAVFAAGCFWCVEAVFEAVEGVLEVESGYAGGTKDTAVYDKVSAGATRHAEAVRITYDARVTYGQLLRVFFATHDPTTRDRQGPDWGPQYRSAIFFADSEEKRIARAYIEQLQQGKIFPSAIVTTLEPLDAFFPAEKYHQDFVVRHPEHPYVRRWALPKLEKLRKTLPELVRKIP